MRVILKLDQVIVYFIKILMQENQFPFDKLINQKQLAEVLSYDARTIRLWQKHTAFPKKIFGGKIFYLEDEVIAWIKKYRKSQAINRIEAKKKFGINSITY